MGNGTDKVSLVYHLENLFLMVCMHVSQSSQHAVYSYLANILAVHDLAFSMIYLERLWPLEVLW
jgi:hypothetical protein